MQWALYGATIIQTLLRYFEATNYSRTKMEFIYPIFIPAKLVYACICAYSPEIKISMQLITNKSVPEITLNWLKKVNGVNRLFYTPPNHQNLLLNLLCYSRVLWSLIAKWKVSIINRLAVYGKKNCLRYNGLDKYPDIANFNCTILSSVELLSDVHLCVGVLKEILLYIFLNEVCPPAGFKWF